MTDVAVAAPLTAFDAVPGAPSPTRSTAFETALAQERASVKVPRAGKALSAPSARKPVIYVIDTFTRTQQYTPSFSLSHGKLIEIHIKAETGVTPRFVDIEQPKLGPLHPGLSSEDARLNEGLKQGLQKVLDENPGSLDHVYVNLSLSQVRIERDTASLLEQLHKRGARLYVAAGNEYVNALCTPHVWCVGANKWHEDAGEYPRNPQTDLRASPEWYLSQVAPGRIDVNGDGKADIAGNLDGRLTTKVNGTSFAAPEALSRDVNRLQRSIGADPNPRRQRD